MRRVGRTRCLLDLQGHGMEIARKRFIEKRQDILHLEAL